MANRSPGHWHWRDRCGRLDGAGSPFGRRFSYLIADDQGLVLARCTVPVGAFLSAERSESNAKLMAAAPDLLDALTVALVHLEDIAAGRAHQITDDDLCLIRQAIAKATA